VALVYKKMKERNINRFIISLLINSDKQNKMSVVILTIDTGFKEDEPLDMKGCPYNEKRRKA